MSQPPSSSDGEKARQSAEQAKSDEASFDNKSSLIVTSILTTELSSDNYSNKSNEVSNTYVSTERRNKNTSNGFFGSLFNSSIGLCSSRNINNQVVPIEQTSKPKVAQSSKSNFFTMTHSLKPKDVIDFVSSIQIEFAPDHDESTIFGNQNGLFLIKYSIVDTTTHPLTPFRSYMKRIISKETTSTSSIATTRNFDMLSSMIEILTEFIENLRKSEDGFFSTKESVDETMVSLEGCLALTDIALLGAYKYLSAVTPLTKPFSLESFHKLLDALLVKCHSLGPLLENSVEPPIKFLFSQCVARACVTVQALAGLIPSTSPTSANATGGVLNGPSPSSRSSYSLSSKVLSGLRQTRPLSTSGPPQPKIILQLCVYLLQSIAPLISLCRRVYQEDSIPTLILFWMSSDSLANLTLRHKVSGSETPFAQSARGLYSSSKSLAAAFVGLSNSLSNSTHGNTAVATNSSISGRTAGINLQSSSSSVARLKTQPNLLPLLSQNNYNSAGLEQGNRLGISPSKSLQVSTSMTLSSSYDYNIKRSLVKSRAGSSTQTQWSTRLRQSLQSTLLTPQEFFGKISRFKHANNIKRNGTTFELLEGDESDRSYEVSLRNTGVFSTTFGSIGQQSEYQYSSRSNLHDLTNHTSLIGLYNLAGMNISNTSFESEGFTLVSYKLKHCLIGVQFLFRLASVESKDIILPITNAHDWMSSFGESFLVLLPVSSAQFKSTDTSFDKLLPFLIELWFQLTIGVEITTNHDWMFWELTKRLSDFVELKQRYTRGHRSYATSSRNQGTSSRLHRTYNSDIGEYDTYSPYVSIDRQYNRRPSAMATKGYSEYGNNPNPTTGIKRRSSMKKINRKNSFPISPNLKRSPTSIARKGSLSKINVQNAIKRVGSTASLTGKIKSSNRKGSRANNSSFHSGFETSFDEPPVDSRASTAKKFSKQQKSLKKQAKTPPADDTDEDASLKLLWESNRSSTKEVNVSIDANISITIEPENVVEFGSAQSESPKETSTMMKAKSTESEDISTNQNTRTTESEADQTKEININSTGDDSSRLATGRTLQGESLLFNDNTSGKSFMSSSSASGQSRAEQIDAAAVAGAQQAIMRARARGIKSQEQQMQKQISPVKKGNRPQSTSGSFIRASPLLHSNSRIVPPLLNMPNSTNNRESNAVDNTTENTPYTTSEQNRHGQITVTSVPSMPNIISSSSIATDYSTPRRKRIESESDMVSITYSPILASARSETTPQRKGSGRTKPSLKINTNLLIEEDDDEEDVVALPTVRQSSVTNTQYIVGDKVDAIFSNENGMTRWFPGTIEFGNVNSTYRIKYDVGDVQDNKPASEIRPYIPSLLRSSRSESLTFRQKATHLFSVSQSVEVQQSSEDGRKRWVNGKIEYIHSNGTYNISISGREVDMRVLLENIPENSIRKVGVTSSLVIPTIFSSQARLKTSKTDLITNSLIRKRSFARGKENTPVSLSVGDDVYGQCTLPSGKKRWFPGKISQVNATDEVYSIVYNDGDTQENKPLSEIRLSKVIVYSGLSTAVSASSSSEGFFVADTLGASTESNESSLRPVTTYGHKLRSFRHNIVTGVSLQDTSSTAQINTARASSSNMRELIYPTDITYALGENVDGYYSLSNGSQRWFPACISAVHLNGTYKLTYQDGDVEDNKVSEQIRKTRIIRKSPSSTVHSLRLPIEVISESSSGESTLLPQNLAKLQDDRTPDSKPLTSRSRVNTPKSTTHKAISPRSTTAISSNTYCVGDIVDGYYLLSNGSRRWYPGKISAVNADGTYTVIYTDGDVEMSKPVSDIRKPKIRSVITTTEVTTQPDNVSIVPHLPLIPALDVRKMSTHKVASASNLMLSNTLVAALDLSTVIVSSPSEASLSSPSTASRDLTTRIYKLGDKVKALYQSTIGKDKWYSGRIDAVYDDGTYKVCYSDGEIHDNKPASEIRVHRRMSTGTFTQSRIHPSVERVRLTRDSRDSGRIDSARDSGKDTGRRPRSRSNLSDRDVNISQNTSGRRIVAHSSQKSDRVLETGRTLSSIDKVEERFISPRSEEFRTSRTEEDDADDDSDSDDSHDDHVFTIPSVFGRARQNPLAIDQINAGIPSMNFNNLNLSGALLRSAAGSNSLSSSLLIEGNEKFVRGLSQGGFLEGDDDEYDDVDDNYYADRYDYLENVNEEDEDENDDEAEDNFMRTEDTFTSTSRLSLRRSTSSRSQFVSARAREIAISPNPNRSAQNFDRLAELTLAGYGQNGSPKMNSSYNVGRSSKGNVQPQSPMYVSSSKSTRFSPPYQQQSAKSPMYNQSPIYRSSKTSPVYNQSGKFSPPFNANGSVPPPPNQTSPKTVRDRPNELSLLDSSFNLRRTSSMNSMKSCKSDWVSVKDDDSNSSSPSRASDIDDSPRARRSSFSSDLPSGPNTSRAPMAAYIAARNEFQNILESVRASGNIEDKEAILADAMAKMTALQNQVSTSQMASLPLHGLPYEMTTDVTPADSFSVAFRMVVVLLLRRCIVDKFFLDTSCCNNRTLANKGYNSNNDIGKLISYDSMRSRGFQSRQTTDRSENSSRGTVSIEPKKHINLALHIREYLNLYQSMDKFTNNDMHFHLFIEIANTLGPSYTRLLKLLSDQCFTSCLPAHEDTATKIGEGTFGSIYRFKCSGQCSKSDSSRQSMKQYFTKLVSATGELGSFSSRALRLHANSLEQQRCVCGCYRKNRLHSEDEGTLLDGVNDQFTLPTQQYAVKRVKNERLPFIYDEIAALESLVGVIGVCQLYDYGRHLEEFWLIMESGGPNLKEWRRRSLDESGYEPFKHYVKAGLGFTDVDVLPTARVKQEFREFSDVVLSVQDTGTCLAIYIDILYIMKAVHAADVVHFDLKCDNLVLKGWVHDDDDSTQENLTESKRKHQMKNRVSELSLNYHDLRLSHSFGRASGRILLIDFGESSAHVSAPRSRSSALVASMRAARGAIPIQSPEILCLDSQSGDMTQTKERKKFPIPGKGSDIWSLGCMLVELLTGTTLFFNRPWVDLYCNLCKKDYVSVETLKFDETLRQSLRSLPPHISNAIENVVVKTLRQMPDDRPSILEMISWIEDILNDDIFKQSIRDSRSSRDTSNRASSVGGSIQRRDIDRSGISEIFEEAALDSVRMREVIATTSQGKLTLRLVENSIVKQDDISRLDRDRTLRMSEERPLNSGGTFAASSPMTSARSNALTAVSLYACLVISDTIQSSHHVSLFQTSFSGISLPSLDTSTSSPRSPRSAVSSPTTCDDVNIEGNFSRVESLLGSSDLSRLSRDLSDRVLRQSYTQKQLLQIIIIDSDEQYKAILKDIELEILPSTIIPLCVSTHSAEQISNLLRSTLAAFVRARDHLAEGYTVVVTVGATLKRKVSDLSFIHPAAFSSGLGSNDTFDDCAEDRTNFIAREKTRFDQEYSKLAVSLACCLTDCLSTWDGLLKTAGDATSNAFSPRVSVSEASYDNRVNSRDGPAARVRNLLAQKACQNACTNQSNDSPSMFDPRAKSTSRSADALMETVSGLPQGITTIAPSLERVCCRRVCNILAAYLGEHSFDPSYV